MKLNSVVVAGLVLSLFTSNAALAGRYKHNPCDENGELKWWAKKRYDADYCAPPTPTNNAPSITITAPGDQTEFTGDQQINFFATANDQEDGDLSNSVIWTSSIDGTISANTMLSTGNHTITASVSDLGSLSANDSISISVVEPPVINTEPTVSIDSPSTGTSVEEGTSFLFKGHASDAEDGDLSSNITWTSSVDGAIGNFTTLSVGDHIITATVTDSEGASSSAEILVSVMEPALPETYSLAIDWIAPSDRADGSYLPPEEISGYRINWNNDSNGSSGSVTIDEGSTTHHQIDELEPGNYRFSLVAIDTEGNSSSKSSDILIELN